MPTDDYQDSPIGNGSDAGIPKGIEIVRFQNGEAFLPVNAGRKGDVSSLQKQIMPVIIIKDGVMKVVGTCFAITNDGLCITAKHVVDELFTKRDLEHGGYRETSEREGRLGVLYLSNEKHPDSDGDLLGGILDVRYIHTARGVDIALLKVTVLVHQATGTPLTMPVFPISMRIPKLDEKFIGFGYPLMKLAQDDEKGVAQFYDCFTATTGEVKEIHFPIRDTVVGNFPCYRTDARFDLGMSGGPLVGTDGHVIGVICSGYDFDQDCISYASLVGPAFALVLDVLGKGGMPERKFLWDLTLSKTVLVEADNVQVRREARAIQIDFGDGRVLTNRMDS